jgi:hypothetical protein
VAAQTTLGCASGDISSKVQREWGRKDGSTHHGSTVESSPAWCRGHATARKGFATSRSRHASTFPRWRPGVAPSNGSRRVVNKAQLSPASSSPLALPHSFHLSSSCGGGQGRGKTLMRLGLREGLGPWVVGAVNAAQGQGHDAPWLAGTADAPTRRRRSGWSRRGERVEGSFPPGEAPRRAHERALARRGCQPAACLSHRARAGAARWGAAWCEGERKKVRRKKRGRG